MMSTSEDQNVKSSSSINTSSTTHPDLSSDKTEQLLLQPPPPPPPDYLDTFPKGYRFIPTDEEVLDYLNLRVEKKALPPNRINEVNLYDHHPEYLTSGTFKAYENKEWYFFTPRDRKYRNGVRPKRAAGNGFWKATGVDKVILWDNVKKEKLGSKKTLVFYEGKPPKGTKTCWVMHEFKVDKSSIQKNSRPDMRLDDCVLCRIHKKKNKSSNTTSPAGSRKRRAVLHHDHSLPSLAEDDHHLQLLNDGSNIIGNQLQDDHLQEEEYQEEEEEYQALAAGGVADVYKDVEDNDQYLFSNFDSSMAQQYYYPTDHHILNDSSLCSTSASSSSIMAGAVSSSITSTVVRGAAIPPLQTCPARSWITEPVLNDCYMYDTTAAPDMVSMSATHNSHHNNIRQGYEYQIQQWGNYSDMLMNSLSSVPAAGQYPPPRQVIQVLPTQGYCLPPPQMPQIQQQAGYHHHQSSWADGNNVNNIYGSSSSGNKLHDHAVRRECRERHMVFKDNDNNNTTEHPEYFYTGENQESFEMVPAFSMIFNGTSTLPDGSTLPDCRGYLPDRSSVESVLSSTYKN